MVLMIHVDNKNLFNLFYFISKQKKRKIEGRSTDTKEMYNYEIMKAQ